jgi:hypothetical protein
VYFEPTCRPRPLLSSASAAGAPRLNSLASAATPAFAFAAIRASRDGSSLACVMAASSLPSFLQHFAAPSPESAMSWPAMPIGAQLSSRRQSACDVHGRSCAAAALALDPPNMFLLEASSLPSFLSELLICTEHSTRSSVLSRHGPTGGPARHLPPGRHWDADHDA